MSSIYFSISHFNHLASKEQDIQDKKRDVCLRKIELGNSPSPVFCLSQRVLVWVGGVSDGVGDEKWSVAQCFSHFLIGRKEARVKGETEKGEGRGGLCSPGVRAASATFNCSSCVRKIAGRGGGAGRWVEFPQNGLGHGSECSSPAQVLGSLNTWSLRPSQEEQVLLRPTVDVTEITAKDETVFRSVGLKAPVPQSAAAIWACYWLDS